MTPQTIPRGFLKGNPLPLHSQRSQHPTSVIPYLSHQQAFAVGSKEHHEAKAHVGGKTRSPLTRGTWFDLTKTSKSIAARPIPCQAGPAVGPKSWTPLRTAFSRYATSLGSNKHETRKSCDPVSSSIQAGAYLSSSRPDAGQFNPGRGLFIHASINRNYLSIYSCGCRVHGEPQVSPSPCDEHDWLESPAKRRDSLLQPTSIS